MVCDPLFLGDIYPVSNILSFHFPLLYFSIIRPKLLGAYV